jgi:hypothetical protein
VLRAVEVGRARGEQAQLAAPFGDEPGLSLIVGDVEGLDPVEAERGEAVDRVEHLGVVVEVPEGMRPDGDPAGVVDDLDRLGHGRGRAAAVPGRPRDQIALEQ